MTIFLLIVAFLLFLADTFTEYWNVEVKPDDITLFFGNVGGKK